MRIEDVYVIQICTSKVKFLRRVRKKKMNIGKKSVLTLLAITVAFLGCELTIPLDPQDFADIQDIRYTEHIQPFIFDTYCVDCHTGADAAGGLQLNSWDNLLAGSDHGEAIIPFDSDNSLMVKMVTRLAGGPHPGELDADTLSQPEVTFLRRWIDNGARFDGPPETINQGVVPYSGPSRPLLYVPNQDDALISVIDVNAKLVIRTIDLQNDPGFNYSPNARPHDIEVEPDGSALYTSLIGDNAVVKISVDNVDQTGEFVGQAAFETPGMLGLNPQNDQLFVGRSLSAVSPPRSIGEITRSSMSLRDIEVVFQRPHALVVDPSGEFAHTASLSENRVLTVNTSTDEVFFTILNAPFSAFIHFALSPDGNQLAASGQESNQVMILNTSAPPGLSRVGSVEVGNQPWHPVWTPDGKRLYVGNREDNTVSVLDGDNNFAILQTISGNGLADPHGSAITPDGAYVFISNQNTSGAYTPRYDLGNNENTGTVVVINTATNEIEKIIEVGRAPAGLSQILE